MIICASLPRFWNKLVRSREGQSCVSPAAVRAFAFLGKSELQGRLCAVILCVCACPPLGKRGEVTSDVPSSERHA